MKRQQVPDKENYKAVFDGMNDKGSMANYHLLGPIMPAVRARATYELASMPYEEISGVASANRDGINVDWQKMKNRFWVPKFFLDDRIISSDERKLLTVDDVVHFTNNLDGFGKVHFGNGKLMGEDKLAKLVENDFRNNVKQYSQDLLARARFRVNEVTSTYRGHVRTMIDNYAKEMSK